MLHLEWGLSMQEAVGEGPFQIALGRPCRMCCWTSAQAGRYRREAQDLCCSGDRGGDIQFVSVFQAVVSLSFGTLQADDCGDVAKGHRHMSKQCERGNTLLVLRIKSTRVLQVLCLWILANRVTPC